MAHGVRFGNHIRYDDKRAVADRVLDFARVRHRHDRIGRHDPESFDPAVGDRAKHIDGLEAGLRGDERCLPETANAIAILGLLDVHVCRERIRHAADLAPAHRVRLARHREGGRAGFPDAARRQMAIDDGVDLVGAARRLIDALAEDGDRSVGPREKLEEAPQ